MMLAPNLLQLWERPVGDRRVSQVWVPRHWLLEEVQC